MKVSCISCQHAQPVKQCFCGGWIACRHGHATWHTQADMHECGDFAQVSDMTRVQQRVRSLAILVNRDKARAREMMAGKEIPARDPFELT